MSETTGIDIGDITLLLAQARAGDRASLDQVFALLYPTLRQLAQARLAQGERTLSPTALVHESYLRLVRNQSLSLVDRQHFLACAARAMRAVVVDDLRSKMADRRGGGVAALSIDAALDQPGSAEVDLLALDAALDALDSVDSAQRELVELHFFGGVDFVEIAQLRGIHEKTVRRHWQRARAFLHAQLNAP